MAAECAGRADDQVKIRGFRVELGEIDTHLSQVRVGPAGIVPASGPHPSPRTLRAHQHPSVRENVTVLRRDINEEHVLVSYFVPHNDDFDVNDIRAHLKTKLPIYAVPSRTCARRRRLLKTHERLMRTARGLPFFALSVFVPLKTMPLTPNGKIDRNKLPFPDTAAMSRRGAGGANVSPGKVTPPRTMLESRLVRWRAGGGKHGADVVCTCMYVRELTWPGSVLRSNRPRSGRRCSRCRRWTFTKTFSTLAGTPSRRRGSSSRSAKR